MKMTRNLLMLLTLFIVGSAFAPLAASAQPYHRYHHRYYRHHRYYHHYDRR